MIIFLLTALMLRLRIFLTRRVKGPRGQGGRRLSQSTKVLPTYAADGVSDGRWQRFNLTAERFRPWLGPWLRSTVVTAGRARVGM